MDEINEGKIEERDEATQQYHRDDNDNSRVTQFLVTAEPFLLRVPRPRTFLQLDFYFAEEVFDFGNHFKVPKKRPTSNAQRPVSLQLRSMFSVRCFRVRRSQRIQHARRDSNPQPTVLETATLPIELLAYLIFLSRLLLTSSFHIRSTLAAEKEVEEEFNPECRPRDPRRRFCRLRELRTEWSSPWLSA